MQLGALVPFSDTGGDPATVRDYAQGLEALGYDFLEAPDHVLGANAGTRPSSERDARPSDDLFHDPFVLLGFLAGITTKLVFSTGVLIVAQRQTALVAKQAACLDVLCEGRFRLGIGVGWNEVEFTGLNENFHNRGRRSEEQVAGDAGAVGGAARDVQGQVPHHRRRRHQSRGRPRAMCRCGLADITRRPCRASPNGATAGCRTPIRRTRPR